MHFGFKELLLILLITLVLFGGKRVKNLGSDLGNAIRGFRKAMKDGEGEHAEPGSLGPGQVNAAETQKTGKHQA
ncbi:MAG: hypothetical protein B7Z66_00030 [Chromatiales bacterium 21-64-14]|nr:MAG: hypothetical protein B7Z66_00030 [Chromatiales bacterium 21-64-14]